MHQATYEETLDKIEEFMRKSELRDFCTKVCQGHCCQGCFTSSQACHKNEGRRLSCSIFLCYSLEELVFDKAEKVIYNNLKGAIVNELQRITSGDIYFDTHDESVRQAFSIEQDIIEQDILDALLKINVDHVKYRLNAFRHLHSISSRFLVKKLQKRDKNGHR